MDIHKAIDKGKFDSDIIDQDFNPSTVNEVDANGNTILHRVVLHPKCTSDVIIQLKTFGAKVNELNKDGDSPLTLAAQRGCSFEVLKTLLKANALVNHVGSDGRSPLCYVLHRPNCDSDIVQVILAAGASAKACSVHTNLFHCYMKSPYEVRADVLKLVLLKVLGLRSFPTQALCIVLNHPSCDGAVVRDLLQMGCRFNQCLMHESSFHCYLDESVNNPNGTKPLKVDVLELLATAPSTVGRWTIGGGQSPLCLVMRHSQCSVDAVAALLKAGYPVTHCHQHMSPLHCYLDKPNVTEMLHLDADVLKVLLDSGLDVNLPNRHGRTPLFMAMHYFNCPSDVLKILLNASATLNECYAHTSLLYCYIGSNNVEIDGMEMILRKCTNINLVNRYGDMPLHWALRFARYEVGAIKLLLDHPDIDVHAMGRRAATYLHCALQNPYCKIQVIELLLKKGVGINGMNSKRHTPLHVAVGNPDCGLDIIQLLIDNGANVRCDNMIPILHIVLRQNRNPDLVRLLLSAGVPINCYLLKMAFNTFNLLHCETSKQCFFMVLKFCMLGVRRVNVRRVLNKFGLPNVHRRQSLPEFTRELEIFEYRSHLEVQIMTEKYLVPHFTLYDLVSSCRGNEVPKFDIDILLRLLVEKRLSVFFDVISMKVDVDQLRNKLRKLQVYAVIPDLQGVGERKLILNGDASCHLSRFLPAKDLLSCVVAYYGAAHYLV